MISIIIPVYRVETYLPQCIESVLAQTYGNYELILVDDGSPDGSGQVCDRYAQNDRRIKVLHQENRGVSVARNHGLSIAQGEWITFIDSDDWVDQDFLQNFQIDNYPNAEVICQGVKYVDHQSGHIKRERRFSAETITAPDKEGKLAKQDILSFGVTVCKCFKTAVIRKNNIQFDESISYHEDHIFTLAFLLHTSNIVTVDACGYNYRCGHNTSSLSKKKHSYQNQRQAGQGMMHELNAIAQHFQLSEAYYRKIATFCLSVKFNALCTLFCEQMSIRKRKQELMKVVHPINDFSKFYYPVDRKYSIVRYLAHDTSGTLLFLFFTFYVRLIKK